MLRRTKTSRSINSVIGEGTNPEWALRADEHLAHENPALKRLINFGDIVAPAGWESLGPLLLTRQALNNHLFVTGGTGAGKTVSLYNLFCQLVSLLALERKSPELSVDHPYSLPGFSIVICDLKGDKAFRVGAQRLAEANRIEFKSYSSGIHLPTHAFPYLSQEWYLELPVHERVSIFLTAMQQWAATNSRDEFFQIAAPRVLRRLLELSPRSFKELEPYLTPGRPPDSLDFSLGRFAADAANPLDGLAEHELKAGQGAFARLEMLIPELQLNVTPNYPPQIPPALRDEILKHAIDLKELFFTNQILYAYLKPTVDPMLAPYIASLLANGLVAISSTLHDQGEPHLPVFFICDEVQRLPPNTLRALIQQARGFKLKGLLACQVTRQLPPELREELLEIVGLRLYCGGMNNDEMKDWIDGSGEQVQWEESYTINEENQVQTRLSSSIRPRHNLNELIHMRNSPELSLVVLRTDDSQGATKMKSFSHFLKTPFTLTAAEYHRRDNCRLQKQPLLRGQFIPEDWPEEVVSKTRSPFTNKRKTKNNGAAHEAQHTFDFSDDVSDIEEELYSGDML